MFMAADGTRLVKWRPRLAAGRCGRPDPAGGTGARLADAAVIAATDLSVPVTVVIVGEEKWPSSSQGRSGMNVAQPTRPP
jgi:hypothetical protein